MLINYFQLKKLYNKCRKEDIEILLKEFENIKIEINYAGKDDGK